MIALLNADAGRIPLADGSVHMCVTSPPYWGLRKYAGLDDGQLGLEPTPEQYVANMVAVFREVRRVLRPDGTLWLNLGDSYAGGSKGSGNRAEYDENFRNSKSCSNKGVLDYKKEFDYSGLKPKDLCGIPWRVAFALQADGWWLRSDIIWAKLDPMPESVTDRPTKAHEYVFLMSKSKKYFYDADAVREEAEYGRRNWSSISGNMAGLGVDGKRGSATVSGADPSAGRNRRTVWHIATAPYSGAHFATYPTALVEPCIKAGTSERGVCPECGSPWERIRLPTGHENKREPAHVPGNSDTKVDSTGWGPTTYATDFWEASCSHVHTKTVPATVLDPFAGSGTTLMVARQLGRSAVGLDLSFPYLRDQARKRLELDTWKDWQEGEAQDGDGDVSDLPLFAEAP